MNRFSTARHERGATLTGYALIMAALVVMSLGAISLLNESSDAVLSDTGSSIGDPRQSTEDVLANPVPEAPPWAADGAGFCTPGFDGCLLGNPRTVDTAAYQPAGLSGDIGWGGSAENIDFSNEKDDLVAVVMLESVVRLNGDWQPPQSSHPDGNPAPVASQPGDDICTYIIHASPATVDSDFAFNIDFVGDVLGTAYNTDFGVDPVFAASGATYPAANYVNGGDNFDISGASFSASSLANTPATYDQIRVFVRC